MTDRYVIVYRFGVLGSERDKTDSDRLVNLYMNNVDPESRPAYRIRIRDKANMPIKRDAPVTVTFLTGSMHINRATGERTHIPDPRYADMPKVYSSDKDYASS